GRGVGGAKGGDRGECGTAKHAPGSEPGKRVPGAGSHTTSSKTEKEGKVHRAPTPHQPGTPLALRVRPRGRRRHRGLWSASPPLRRCRKWRRWCASCTDSANRCGKYRRPRSPAAEKRLSFNTFRRCFEDTQHRASDALLRADQKATSKDGGFQCRHAG